MPVILAIETSTEVASVTLRYRDQSLSRETSGVQNHSQTVLPMVQELLALAGIGLTQCDAIAFGSGPGSFTGVRTACGVTQGLAFGADIPVIPVVTLQAMAQACREAYAASNVLALLDARMGEVYWAQYRYDDGWHTVREPALGAPEHVLVPDTVTACGNGLTAYQTAFATANFARTAAEIMPHAAAIAQLACSEWEKGRAIPVSEAAPLYLRNKVALTTAERLARSAS